jgi:MSHA pilin protein MshA
MKQVQRGFTLIELARVTVILGVLAVVAIPNFVDLKGTAQTAVVKSPAAASPFNYAACSPKNNSTVSCRYVNVVICDGVRALLSGGAWPKGYMAAGTGSSTNGAAMNCMLTASGSTTTFDAIAGGN